MNLNYIITLFQQPSNTILPVSALLQSSRDPQRTLLQRFVRRRQRGRHQAAISSSHGPAVVLAQSFPARQQPVNKYSGDDNGNVGQETDRQSASSAGNPGQFSHQDQPCNGHPRCYVVDQAPAAAAATAAAAGLGVHHIARSGQFRFGFQVSSTATAGQIISTCAHINSFNEQPVFSAARGRCSVPTATVIVVFFFTVLIFQIGRRRLRHVQWLECNEFLCSATGTGYYYSLAN